MTSIEPSPKTIGIMANKTRFQEFFESEIAADKIDREAGVIKGVKVIGFKSRNGREYTPKALKEALSMYEGAKVYVDHKAEGRNFHERWGKLRNCSFVEGKGVFGDLHYLQESPLTKTILEAITRFNDSGLSHDADGIMESVSGKNVVTKIERVHSVDFVESPATNSNLFESFEMKTKILAALREAVDQKPIAQLLARLAESKQVSEDAEFEPSSDATKLVEAVGAAFSHVAASAKDASTALSGVVTLAVGGSVEDLQAKLKEATDKNVALDAEIKTLKESAEKTSAREACVKLLESLDRDVSDMRVEALLAISAEKRQHLAESWEVRKQRPDSSKGKFQESGDNGGDQKGSLPESPADFKAAIL